MVSGYCCGNQSNWKKLPSSSGQDFLYILGENTVRFIFSARFTQWSIFNEIMTSDRSVVTQISQQ